MKHAFCAKALFHTILLIALGQIAVGDASLQAAETGITTPKPIDFDRDIRPILSTNCFHCHGPDSSHREADLRLDTHSGATAARDEGPAIVPGHPEKSLLVTRITSKDNDERMPPADSGRSLTAEQIDLLERWVAAGAPWTEHWAFVSPKRPALPRVSDPAWSNNPVDPFVYATLQQAGLKPNQEADRRVLIRRVTLDLTGLLPTPQEVDAFVADTAPHAYEKVVDRLLASPRYGEHRGRYWLDYVRYGDTQGIHSDSYQSRWPYRDYVIRAFNEDKPYDQFTREQLAGDLLPPERVDQLVATGMVRCGIATGEGGTIVEELKCNLKRERVEAFGAVYMGMTTGCAVCHDHKYDPLSTKDFYALTAFFNNIAEKPATDDRSDWPPNLLVPKEPNRASYDAALAKRAAAMRGLQARRAKADELIQAWIAAGGPRSVAAQGLVLRLRLDENPNDASEAGSLLHNSAPGASPATFSTTGPKPHWGEETWLWPTFRLETNTRLDLGQIGDFEKDQPFACGGWIKVRNVPDVANGNVWNPPGGALISKMDNAHGHRGWNIYYEKGTILVQLASTWPNAISIRTTGTTEKRGIFSPIEESGEASKKTVTVPRGNWTHIFFTYDGSGKAAGVKIYINGHLQKVAVEHDTLNGSIRNEIPTWLARRHDGQPMQGTAYQDIRMYRRALSADEVARLLREDVAAEIVARKKPNQWTEDERAVIEDHYFAAVDKESLALTSQMADLEVELEKLGAGGNLTLVCREKPGMAYADVLSRGNFTARVARVRPNVPSFLPPLPVDAPRNRLGLADWVVSKDNPLTARVTVNRAWQELFGFGLVATSEDFGTVGQRPSHPELLDWLAVDFVESGWKLKRIYKMLVMSATYRQSAKATAEAIAKDPQNRLLSRGPRFRMDGEILRDCALQASGLLREKLGGPSVKPYQPSGVWGGAFGGGGYAQDHGESLYRRSLYTFWKRMAPMPNLEAFDATDRTSSCIRRQRTDTPLAALVLMNDPQYLEAARNLAVRILKEDGSTPESRLDFLGRVLLAHEFSPADRETLLVALQRFTAKFAKDETKAKALLAVGESPVDAKVPAIEQAIWMMMVTTVMNMDATINK